MGRLKPCLHPGCPEIVTGSYCRKHASRKDRQRGTSRQRGYSSRWERERAAFLKTHPLCECDDCRRRPVPKIADTVDHIIPHKGDQRLMWDRSNWMAMNRSCHSKKTATKDRGSWIPKLRP